MDVREEFFKLFSERLTMDQRNPIATLTAFLLATVPVVGADPNAA